jgi:hypothetical protein
MFQLRALKLGAFNKRWSKRFSTCTALPRAVAGTAGRGARVDLAVRPVVRRAVVPQFKFVSKTRKQLIKIEFQALKPGAYLYYQPAFPGL